MTTVALQAMDSEALALDLDLSRQLQQQVAGGARRMQNAKCKMQNTNGGRGQCTLVPRVRSDVLIVWSAARGRITGSLGQRRQGSSC